MKRMLCILLAALLLCCGCAGEAKEPDTAQWEALEQHAVCLTGQLVAYALSAPVETVTEEIPENRAAAFLLAPSEQLEQAGYRYSGLVSRDQALQYHFPLDGLQQEAFEVFGIEDWHPDAAEWGLVWEEESRSYIGGLEFGFVSFYGCEQLTVHRGEKTLAVSFLLTSSPLYPDPVQYGEYAAEYTVLQGENGWFVRLNGFVKV